MHIEYTTILAGIGRLLIGAYFALAGIHHFRMIPQISQAIAARGVPAAKLVLLTGSTLQIVAGVLLAAGVFVRCAAWALIVFTITASILLVDFWNKRDAARETAVGTWKTNLALIGGLLVVAATGA